MKKIFYIMSLSLIGSSCQQIVIPEDNHTEKESFKAQIENVSDTKTYLDDDY